MRQTYALSDETRLVLTDYVKPISFEMHKSDKYIYAILSNTEPDRFAQFKPLYAAAVRTGAPVCHWDNWFASMRARYEQVRSFKSEIECLTEKIKADADTTTRLVEALRDGFIDTREAVQIREAVERERRTLDLVEAMVNFKQVAPKVAKG